MSASSSGDATVSRTRGLRLSTGYLVALVLGLSLYANASYLVSSPDALGWFPPFRSGVDLNRNQHLGAEYFRIAESLVAGRGFSDPFGLGTGPTAWMPPVYPALLAALLWVLGKKAWVAIAIVLLKNAVLVWAGMTVYAAAQKSASRIRPGWSLVAYTLWLVAHFDWFFQFTHDTWLLLLIVTASFAFGSRILAGDPPRLGGLGWQWGWGLLGGLNLLSSPIAGFAWGAASAFLALYRGEARRPLAAAVTLALLCTSGWVVRNAVVFDRMILMKSNLYFDLYFANYVSPDGVYDDRFFLAHHPIWTAARNPDSLYAKAGEIAYVDSFRDRFFGGLRQHPGLYLRKAGNRLLAATVVFHPYRPAVSGRHPPLRSLIHALPALGLALLLVRRRLRLTAPMGLALVLYASYLAPYVAVAYYDRYLLPLSAVLVLFCFWAADAGLVGHRTSEGSRT